MIDTGTFIAGVGVLVTLDVMCIAAIFNLQRVVGKDPVARQRARKAMKAARRAEGRHRPGKGD